MKLTFPLIFYFNFTMCLVLYAGMFVAAPFIADFYEDSSLTAVIRVLSLTIVISGVKGIQQAYVSRNMLFKRFFFATIGGTIFCSICWNRNGLCWFRVWALVTSAAV